MSRARNSGYSLTEADAAIVKGMLARKDRQHDIAAWFGVNGGRIAEIATGNAFPDVMPTVHELPPPGPYVYGRGLLETKKSLEDLKSELQGMIQKIDLILRKNTPS